MSAAVLITKSGDAVIAFEFCYSAVEEIKARIPGYARSWDPERKLWTVEAGPFVPVAVSILKDIFGEHDVHVEDERATRGKRYHSPNPPPASHAYQVLHLQPTAPPELITVAYKTLARLNHPDAGGDTAAMQEINEAYSALQSGGSR